MKKRLRMVQLTHLDGPGGGPRRIIQHMLFYLAEFDSTILHGGNGLVSRMCKRIGIPHYQLALDRKRWLAAGFFQLLWRLFTIGPDVIILHGQWAGPVGAVAARLARIPVIIYIVQWPAFYTDWDPWRILRNFFSEWIPCRLAGKVVALCDGPRQQFLLRGLCPPEKILSIPNPLGLSVLPSEAERTNLRKRWGWEKEQVHVVSVGRLVDQKRVDWLIRAWPKVLEACPQARLWIIGDGPQRKNLETLAGQLDPRRPANIRFLGEQAQGWVFIAAADVLVMTTAYEGLGSVAVEAMAAGVPVVASDVDGPRDMLVHGREGFLVLPGDVAGLAARISQLATDPKLRVSMGKKGIERAREFDAKRVLRQYREVIRQMAREKGL